MSRASIWYVNALIAGGLGKLVPEPVEPVDPIERRRERLRWRQGALKLVRHRDTRRRPRRTGDARGHRPDASWQ